MWFVRWWHLCSSIILFFFEFIFSVDCSYYEQTSIAINKMWWFFFHSFFLIPFYIWRIHSRRKIIYQFHLFLFSGPFSSPLLDFFFMEENGVERNGNMVKKTFCYFLFGIWNGDLFIHEMFFGEFLFHLFFPFVHLIQLSLFVFSLSIFINPFWTEFQTHLLNRWP